MSESPTHTEQQPSNKPSSLRRPSFLLGLAIGMASIFALVASFHLGSIIGFRKASFSCAWNRNYGPLFGFPESGQMPPMMKRLPDPHGAFGKILRVEDNQLIIKDRNGTEKSVSVTTTTSFRKGLDTVRLEDIKTDDTVAVFGKPDEQGHIQADLIRVLRPEDTDRRRGL